MVGLVIISRLPSLSRKKLCTMLTELLLWYLSGYMSINLENSHTDCSHITYTLNRSFSIYLEFYQNYTTVADYRFMKSRIIVIDSELKI